MDGTSKQKHLKPYEEVKMFKDKMVTPATPERVYTLCKILEKGSKSVAEIREKMEPAEWGRIIQLLTQLRHELQENEDSPALRHVILGYIRLILEYCQRIYLRQLSKEAKTSSDILKRFHNLLRDYFLEGRQMELGIPSVRYCADRLAYSPRYLGDVIHKSTGGTAIGYIHSFVIEQGKSLLMNGHNIGETALLLGFEFPHHFTRLFKKVTGITPTDFLGK